MTDELRGLRWAHEIDQRTMLEQARRIDELEQLVMELRHDRDTLERVREALK